jgi:hypothetical protein
VAAIQLAEEEIPPWIQGGGSPSLRLRLTNCRVLSSYSEQELHRERRGGAAISPAGFVSRLPVHYQIEIL